MSLPLRFCLFWFCAVGHLTFFHIYFNYVNFGQNVQDFLYTLQGAPNYVFIHAEKNQFMARVNRNIQSEQNPYQKIQGVQGLLAFAFCAVDINDEHTKLRFTNELLFLIKKIVWDGL